MEDMEARRGMLIVETIAKIRRADFVQQKPIKVICREFGLSRKVVRKVIRSEAPSPLRSPTMPHKANAARRHHILRPKRKVVNWVEYDAALRQRGSLTVWVTDEALEHWTVAPRTTPGGQPSYSDLAITTALMLRAVFRLALRQTEGLLASILHLLGLELPVPDHSTIARRARTVTLPSAPCSSGGLLHLLVDSTGAEAVWAGRMVDREARHQEAAFLARSAHWDGRGQRPDCRRHADRPRRR